MNLPLDYERRVHWRFDRRIGVDTLIAVIGIVGTILWRGSAILDEVRTANVQMDKRVSILEVKQEAQVKTDERQDAAISQGQARIEDSLREIRNKLDRNNGATK